MPHALVGLLDHRLQNHITLTSALWGLQANPPKDWTFSFTCIGGISPVHRARNMAVEVLLQSEATHMLFLGSDHVFGDSNNAILHRLISTWDEPIVGGVYLKMEQSLDAPLNLEVIGAPRGATTRTPAKEPGPAEYVGMDLTLIKREVFENPKMQLGPNRWYQTVYDEGGKTLLSEDVEFCQRAWAAGYRVWVDPFVFSGHWKTVDLNSVYTFAEQLAVRVIHAKDAGTQPVQPEAGAPREVPEASGGWPVDPGKQDGGMANVPGRQLESDAGQEADEGRPAGA